MIRRCDNYIISCPKCGEITKTIPINPYSVTTCEVVIYNNEFLIKTYSCIKCNCRFTEYYYYHETIPETSFEKRIKRLEKMV